INDPDCGGQGCFPAGAPVDGTVPCCDHLWPDASGRCAPVVCGDAACSGSGETAHASGGEVLSFEGVSFTVPSELPQLWVTSTTELPPAMAVNGATIVARSPVFELGPIGSTFDPPLAVSFLVGGETDLVVFWSDDGLAYAEIDSVRVAGALIVVTDHFSRALVAGNPCKGMVEGDVCGVPPAGDCAAAPTCVAQGAALKCTARFQAADTVCRAAAGECDVTETCDGASAACPEDAQAAAGVPCDDGDPATNDDVCGGAGVCAGSTSSCTVDDQGCCWFDTSTWDTEMDEMPAGLTQQYGTRRIVFDSWMTYSSALNIASNDEGTQRPLVARLDIRDAVTTPGTYQLRVR
ncbi:MAG: hypothetical protein Q8M74_03365, partial [Chloroflexota bacterium]|nr:hypothetical protein [Chloroflexota bacterium]